MGTVPATATTTSETRNGTPTICPTIRTTHLRSPSTSIRYAAKRDASGSSREAAIGGDKFTTVVNEVVPVTTASWPELWGIHGSEVPAYAIESEPGDMLLFNHKLKHSSWGGGDRRRMFTYNFEQYFPDNLIGSLRKLVVPYHERGDDAPYGEALLRTAGPRAQTSSCGSACRYGKSLRPDAGRLVTPPFGRPFGGRSDAWREAGRRRTRERRRGCRGTWEAGSPSR